MNTKPVSLLFLNYRWDYGGAERQLAGLLRHLDSSKFSIWTVSLYDGGPLEQEVKALGHVKVLSLGKRGRWDLSAWSKLWRLIRQIRPQIIHGYTTVPNLAALLMGKISGAKVVWGIRDSNYKAAGFDRGMMKVAYAVYRRVAPVADLVIFGSFAANTYYGSHGYYFQRSTIIPNGLDSECFRPDREARNAMRRRWDLAPDTTLIGMVARLSPEKDHPTFLRAARILSAIKTDVRFVCVGTGAESYRKELRELAAALGLSSKMVWISGSDEMRMVYNAFDLHTLCSLSEGRASVVAESMACGVPCVVTDVGDNARVAGKSGIVVEPGNPEALAKAWHTMLIRIAEEGDALTGEVRQQAMSESSFQLLADRTTAALIGIAN